LHLIALLTLGSASLEFLRNVTDGAGKSIIQRCLTDEELLQTQPLDQVPDDNKPDNEWIAARLKIRHEFRTRLAAGVQRKLKRTKEHGFYNKGDEMWIHCRPDDEKLKNWRIKNRCTLGEKESAEGHQNEAIVKDEVTGNESESTLQGRGEEGNTDASMPDNWLGCHPALTGSSSGKDRLKLN
jgi:platelet-activating factor acetylhydrolase